MKSDHHRPPLEGAFDERPLLAEDLDEQTDISHPNAHARLHFGSHGIYSRAPISLTARRMLTRGASLAVRASSSANERRTGSASATSRLSVIRACAAVPRPSSRGRPSSPSAARRSPPTSRANGEARNVARFGRATAAPSGGYASATGRVPVPPSECAEPIGPAKGGHQMILSSRGSSRMSSKTTVPRPARRSAGIKPPA
jgi:hypothetical protein